MKKGKNISYLFFCSLALTLCVFLNAATAAAPRLAVRAFDNKTDSDSVNAPSQAVTDMMMTELYDAGLFSLLERERLDYITDELALGESGLMDPETAPKIGKIKGAQYTMTGAVTQYKYNAGGAFLPIPGIGGGGLASKTALVTLDIRIIDNVTGEIVYAASESGTAKREVGGLVTKYGGFGTVSYGGILAAAARQAVMKHVSVLSEIDYEYTY